MNIKLEHMTLDELFAEGKRLQAEMLTMAEQTQRVYEMMYHRARRNPDASTPAYISLANSGKRIASMVGLGLKRAGSFDRILANVKKDMEEQERREKEKQARKDAKAAKEGRPVGDPLAELFGPDISGQPVETEGFMVPSEMEDVYGEEV